MSRIGVSTNLFQPGTQCMCCKHWIPATRSFKGCGFGGYCKPGYCKKKEQREKEMIKCKDCRFGGLKVLLDNESAPCLRLDDEECPNYNEETGEIEMRNAERRENK